MIDVNLSIDEVIRRGGHYSDFELYLYLDSITKEFNSRYTTELILVLNTKIERVKSDVKDEMYLDLYNTTEGLSLDSNEIFSIETHHMKRIIKILEKNLNPILLNNSKNPKHPLTFAELFKPEFSSRLEVFFERLRLSNIIDENNDWIIKNSTNEPAKLYHYLKDRQVLNDIKFSPAIKCFYKEFGCEVVEKTNGNPRACTRINTLIQCDNATEKIYNSFLLSLINQK